MQAADPQSFDTAAAGRSVALVTFIGGIGGGLVFPILPALGLQLGIAGGMIGLILSANRLTRLAFAPWAGRLVDRLGGKLPLAVGLIIEGIGILGYNAALRFGHAAFWFLAGRAVFGVGSALLLVGAQAAMLGLSNAENRGRRMAAVRIAMGMGIPGGLVLGGLIADRISDAAAFFTGVGLTVFGAMVALWLVPGFRARGADASSSPERPAPKMPLMRLRSLPEFPFIAAAGGFNLLVFLAMQGVLLATLVLLVKERGFHLMGLADEGSAGLIMAVMMAFSSIFAFFFGRLLDRINRRTVLLIPSLAGLVAGFILLGTAANLFMTLVGVALTGIAFNGINLPLLALLGDITSPERYGRGSHSIRFAAISAAPGLFWAWTQACT